MSRPAGGWDPRGSPAHWAGRRTWFGRWDPSPAPGRKKHAGRLTVFFICHSFQMACRFFKVAEITKRKSTAFGVFPVHFINNAAQDSMFKNITDPFYAVDSRDYQATKPALAILDKMGAKILAIEKARPHVPYERALMAIRFSRDYLFQNHPPPIWIHSRRYLRN